MKICPSCLERFPQEAETCPRDGTDLKDIQARSDDELVGRVLEDRWVIDELIGRGGMGTVYKGRQRSVDRPVAIKVLRTDLSYKEESVERFFREANLAANINNANCVTIFDFGQSNDGEILYLAMEYLEGESLLERSRREPLTYDQLCEVGAQICSALNAFHGEDVVHRDLKPENIFLVENPSDSAEGGDLLVKVFDFGIAKSLEEESRSVTQTGDVIGTPPFMSPEQCSGESLDPRSDLYSLGCILFEQLSGRVPFTGDTAVDLLISHAHRDPPRLDKLQPDMPAPFVELVHELLEKHPGARPSSAEEVRERLVGIRESMDAREAVETTRGSGSGDTATQRALDSDEKTRPLTDHDYETIAELGYVPDDVDGNLASDEEESTSIAAVVAVALVVLAAGGGIGWSQGWFVTASVDGASGQQLATAGEPTDVGEVGPDTARLDSVSGLADAGDAEAGMSDANADVSAEVKKTLRALKRAQKQARQQAEQGPSAESATASESRSGAQSDQPAGESAATDSEDDRSASPLAEFPLLTGESAAAVFEQKTPKVRACFETHLGQTPEADGDVELQVVVRGSGDVKSASIVGGSVDSEGVRDCVTEDATSWKFPPTPSGSPVAIRHTYGFTFEWQ